MAVKDSPVALVRELNLVRVIDEVRSRGEISRADLTDAVGLSRQTVSSVVSQLISAGLLRESPGRPGGQGRRPKVLSLNGAAGKVASIQVEARRLRVVLSNLVGEVEPRFDIELGEGVTVHSITRAIQDISPLGAAAIAVPGVRHPRDGRIRLAPTAPALEGTHLEQEVMDHSGIPVLVENDVNLAAVGESWKGVARGISNVAFLWLGPGVGLGIISDGEILRGARGNAGEIGFLAFELGAEGNGGARTLENTVSERAIVGEALRVASEGHTGLATVSELNLDTLFKVAALGDPKAGRIEADLVKRVAGASIAVASICDPELIVLGGSVAESGGSRFVDKVRESVSGRVPASFSLELTGLGDEAVLKGGVAVALAKARRELVSVTKEGAK
jgi:predicted NBD/HSP70 family sugar kinase